MTRLLAWIVLIHPLACLGRGLEELDRILKHPNFPLLNSSDECGISNSERIVGGTDAPMGAYPWLARIGYARSATRRSKPVKVSVFICAGTIINKLHVLTAAHCVVDLPHKLIPVSIRLGEHNTNTNPDCDQSYCNDPYQDRDIDEIVSHENYDTYINKNDIALIRVTKEINFTNFVRPICLVKKSFLEKDFSGQMVDVAGWGAFNLGHQKPSIILQTVRMLVLAVSKCSNHRYYKGQSIDSTQLCIGGKVGKDSCVGDSGGPVMTIDQTEGEGGLPRYYVIGIVSYGPAACGIFDLPGIYTNVSKYILWILDHLKPLD